MKAINTSTQTTLAENILLADKFVARLAGLLGRKTLPRGQGMLLKPCRSIHTFFMSFNIDAAFLNSEGEIIYIVKELPPFRTTPVIIGARAVLELPAGTISETGTCIGDKIIFQG